MNDYISDDEIPDSAIRETLKAIKFVDETEEPLPTDWKWKDTISRIMYKALEPTLLSGIDSFHETSEKQSARRSKGIEKTKLVNELIAINPELSIEELKAYTLEQLKAFKPDNAATNEIIELFNKICVSYSPVKIATDNIKNLISACMEKHTVTDLETVFKKAEKSVFLKGKNERNWKATFEWLINPDNISKVLNGNYDNVKNTKPGFDTMMNREYDFSDLEKQIRAN